MSVAYENFKISILDSERILEAYDLLNKDRAGGREPEELKRAALIMTLTAWETYVEDRVKEEVDSRLRALDGSQVANYIRKQLENDLKFFHNPNSKKTKHIFEDFVGLDVTEHWKWDNMDQEAVRTKLNKWIQKRGDAVHRSVTDKQSSHLVSREDMKKCIGFFKRLVENTDASLKV
ncbi:HEPN domain-containing protein [Pontibacterium granulatum]|uniref:HEPN domain-containing protein n=1 Tax=Pontibacterium granulatum TaxID=2036029 RepID=UPI00249C0590|nr:HEPN domain-containing protein [Pontibacterium granulatum]MDI3323401.1 HEPN domain-containing protein [Pontibacterium granulatum]